MKQKPITIKRAANSEAKNSSRRFFWTLILAGIIISRSSAVAEDLSIGFLFDRFQLTLEDGCRTEAAGPFYYSQHTESESVWAVPPFFSFDRNPSVESHEDDFLYPLLSHIRYGHEQRWQFGQLISTARSEEHTSELQSLRHLVCR